MTIAMLLDQAVCAGIRGSDRALIVGIGDDRQRDDGVGPAVVRRLCGQATDSVGMRAVGGDAEDLRARWGKADLAVIVLAARHDSSNPGTIHTLTTELPRVDTTAAALRDDRLSGLPCRVVVYTVEGASFAAGTGLSPDVEAAVERVADHIQRQVAALPPGQHLVPDQRGEVSHPVRPSTVVAWPGGTGPPGRTDAAPPGVMPRL